MITFKRQYTAIIATDRAILARNHRRYRLTLTYSNGETDTYFLSIAHGRKLLRQQRLATLYDKLELGDERLFEYGFMIFSGYKSEAILKR